MIYVKSILPNQDKRSCVVLLFKNGEKYNKHSQIFVILNSHNSHFDFKILQLEKNAKEFYFYVKC